MRPAAGRPGCGAFGVSMPEWRLGAETGAAEAAGSTAGGRLMKKIAILVTALIIAVLGVKLAR